MLIKCFSLLLTALTATAAMNAVQPSPTYTDELCAYRRQISYVAVVDQSTSVATSEQVGTLKKPFATLQQALDKASKKNRRAVIILKSGTYQPEDGKTAFEFSGSNNLTVMALGKVQISAESFIWNMPTSEQKRTLVIASKGEKSSMQMDTHLSIQNDESTIVAVTLRNVSVQKLSVQNKGHLFFIKSTVGALNAPQAEVHKSA